MGVTNYNCPLDRIYCLLREDPSVVQLVSEYGFAHSSSSGRDYAYGRARSHRGITCFQESQYFQGIIGTFDAGYVECWTCNDGGGSDCSVDVNIPAILECW